MKTNLNRNDFLLICLRKGISLYILLTGIMTLARAFFVSYFSPPGLVESHSQEIMQAFYMGWRYDTIVASYLLAPFAVFSIITSLIKWRFLTNVFFKLSFTFYLLMALVVLFLVGADLGFYSYFQDHLNILFFGLIEDDTQALMETVWKNYPVGWGLGGLLFVVVLFWFSLSRIFRPLEKYRSFFHPGAIKFTLMSATTLVLLFGGARGGYGDMVLSPKYADFSSNIFINQIAVNGILSFEKAVKLRKRRNSKDFYMEKAMGYKDIHEAFSDFLGLDTSPTSKEQLVSLLERRTPVNEKLEKLRPHVVVLLMESFGASWLKYQGEGFNFLGGLEEHIKDDLYFKNFISGDNGTIGSLMVVATNVPNRPGARYLSESRYMQMPLSSAAHIPYKQNGYETSFVYGGKLGWRDIGKYFQRQGYHHVQGENAIKDELALQGRAGTEWGLYDEHLFDFIRKKLEGAKRPQFILALSTSNHPPFETPKDYQGPSLSVPTELEKRITREEDLFLERFKAFEYANHSLADFISEVKGSELSKNTVVSFTGDHNFWGFMSYGKEEIFTKFTVPFYIFAPQEIRPSSYDLEKLGSHEDIFPTLYNLTLSDTPFIAFGENLFGPNQSYALGGAIQAANEGVIYDKKNYVWKEMPQVGDETKESFQKLRNVWRSSISVSDFYLRSLFRKQAN